LRGALGLRGFNGDSRPGRLNRLTFEITEFFVRPNFLPISLAEYKGDPSGFFSVHNFSKLAITLGSHSFAWGLLVAKSSSLFFIFILVFLIKNTQ
jgi:hypothetical protein